MKRTHIALAALVLTSLGATIAQAGGSATVTIVTAPKEVVAGHTFDVVFAVRPDYPGMRRSLEPTVKAVCGDRVVKLDAKEVKDGRYVASLTLPTEGNWVLTVDSRYCETKMKALTLKASLAKDAQS
jgi:hypothetical protein